MAKIKICGLKRLDDIEIINKYKPDYVGFVFADSKRKVSHDLARQMKENLDSSITSVGVFVDADVDEIISLYDDGIIDIAQLHGSESEEFNPYAVDLSSGVETNGYKDELKIKEVMEAINE